ncbi:uncharacterized protein LODBEIA_P14870 [Lodderomyces beijingensis]|uniref:RNA polymerase I-specific transcription initiation factor RRN11 n=1 Tax=Lodderomyces beijingensis TaxID=1775926 RepID=A0ABP0ZI08_9ASCO
MFFEDITDTLDKNSSTRLGTQRLVSKHAELTKFESVYEQSTQSQRRQLRDPRVRKAVEKLLHRELSARAKRRPQDTFEIVHEVDDSGDSGDNKSQSKGKGKGKGKSKRKDKRVKVGYEGSSIREKIAEFLDLQQRGGGDGSDEESEHDEKFEEYDIVTSNKLQQYNEHEDTRGKQAMRNYYIESSGLEIMPTHANLPSTEISRHVSNMNTLLHLNILRKNWKLAYKIFCILIRFPEVDIRLIWPLGIEILINLSHGDGIYGMKVTKFYDYLNSFFVVRQHVINRSVRPSAAPVWRTGSRTMVALYLISSLWHLFIQKDYETALAKIEELVIVPPYIHEGVLYYIAALCHLCQCCQIVDSFQLQGDFVKFSESGAMYRSFHECKQLLEQALEYIKKNLASCKKYKFEVDDEAVVQQWHHVMLKLENIRAENEETSMLKVGSDEEDEKEENKALPNGQMEVDEWGAISDDDGDDDGNDGNGDFDHDEAQNGQMEVDEWGAISDDDDDDDGNDGNDGNGDFDHDEVQNGQMEVDEWGAISDDDDDDNEEQEQKEEVGEKNEENGASPNGEVEYDDWDAISDDDEEEQEEEAQSPLEASN